MKEKLIKWFKWWQRKPFSLDVLFGVTIAFSLVLLGFDNDDVVGLVVSLFSVFFGASLAFKADAQKEQEKEKEKKVKSLNLALFSLGRMINAVEIMKHSMKPYMGDAIKMAFFMEASKNVEYGDISFEYADLDFILDSSDKNLLLEISIEKERFEQVLAASQIRSDFYVNEYQKVFEAKGLSGKKMNASQLRAEIGERIYEGVLTGPKRSKNFFCQALHLCLKPKNGCLLLVVSFSRMKGLWPSFLMIRLKFHRGVLLQRKNEVSSHVSVANG